MTFNSKLCGMLRGRHNMPRPFASGDVNMQISRAFSIEVMLHV